MLFNAKRISKKRWNCNIGPLTKDGRYALYARSDTKDIPKEWCGFPVINTKNN